MSFNPGSRRGDWHRRRHFGAVLGLVLMLVDVVGAAAVRPPGGEAARLLADTRLVCTPFGMRPGGQPANGGSDHLFCVFCLPLAHAAGAATAPPSLPLPRAVGGEALAIPSARLLRVEARCVLPPARAPPSELEHASITT